VLTSPALLTLRAVLQVVLSKEGRKTPRDMIHRERGAGGGGGGSSRGEAGLLLWTVEHAGLACSCSRCYLPGSRRPRL
jgi:hypothetical protein